MITRDQLQAAIDVCGWACVECGSDQITVGWDGEPIADSGHWDLTAAARRGVRRWLDLLLRRRVPTAYRCPVLIPGSPAMVRCALDVLDALHAAGLPVPDYGAVTRYSERVAV